MGIAHPVNVMVTQLAGAFSKWRHASDIRFIYEPGLNTSNPAAFRLCWTMDPSNASYGLASTSSRLVQYTDMDDSPFVVSFAGWSPMALDCPTDRVWHYRHFPAFYLDCGSTGGLVTADARDAFSGICSIVETRIDTPAYFQCGLLFIETVIEFEDPFPATSVAYFALARATRALATKNGIVEPDDDPDEPESKFGFKMVDPPTPCSSPRAAPPPARAGAPSSLPPPLPLPTTSHSTSRRV